MIRNKCSPNLVTRSVHHRNLRAMLTSAVLLGLATIGVWGSDEINVFQKTHEAFQLCQEHSYKFRCPDKDQYDFSAWHYCDLKEGDDSTKPTVDSTAIKGTAFGVMHNKAEIDEFEIPGYIIGQSLETEDICSLIHFEERKVNDYELLVVSYTNDNTRFCSVYYLDPTQVLEAEKVTQSIQTSQATESTQPTSKPLRYHYFLSARECEDVESELSFMKSSKYCSVFTKTFLVDQRCDPKTEIKIKCPGKDLYKIFAWHYCLTSSTNLNKGNTKNFVETVDSSLVSGTAVGIKYNKLAVDTFMIPTYIISPLLRSDVCNRVKVEGITVNGRDMVVVTFINEGTPWCAVYALETFETHLTDESYTTQPKQKTQYYQKIKVDKCLSVQEDLTIMKDPLYCEVHFAKYGKRSGKDKWKPCSNRPNLQDRHLFDINGVKFTAKFYCRSSDDKVLNNIIPSYGDLELKTFILPHHKLITQPEDISVEKIKKLFKAEVTEEGKNVLIRFFQHDIWFCAMFTRNSHSWFKNKNFYYSMDGSFGRRKLWTCQEHDEVLIP